MGRIVVNHNMQSMYQHRQLKINTENVDKSSEKLASGYKINHANDEAAELTVSEAMRNQIRGLNKASNNIQDGIGLVQTADAALEETQTILDRMVELTTQAANDVNTEEDRKAIQDEIDQLTTEIDRVSETTKFNETYLLKGDGAEKAHNVNAHDAGLAGVTLTDKGDTVDVTLKELNAGDKISIAGKNYTIGALADDAKKLYDGVATDGTATVTVNGKAYTVQNTTPDADKNQISKDDLDKLVKAGATVEYNGKSLTVMDADANGVDKNDSSVITADAAYKLERAEIVKASSIGSDVAATATDGATTDKFTLTKGKVNYNDALSFNLHVGADADMTNKITVNIDSMNSAGLGVKGIKADTEQDATYAIDAIADAISTVSSQRSALGAVQNRLEHTINNLDNVVENTTSAESRIRDTDMAEEMVNYSKNNILAQAGQSMLAQANQSNQGVLSLLQ